MNYTTSGTDTEKELVRLKERINTLADAAVKAGYMEKKNHHRLLCAYPKLELEKASEWEKLLRLGQEAYKQKCLDRASYPRLLNLIAGMPNAQIKQTLDYFNSKGIK